MAANSTAAQPSSIQRSNDGIKSLTGIVWFELYLQATLSAIQECDNYSVRVIICWGSLIVH
jgi:hypothetical protein